MLTYLIICLAAFLGSGLTLFSGFGLGTILLPVFALFFPVELAVVLTAIVHFLNNVFKLALLGRHADRGVVLRFGLPAIFAALAGAWALSLLADMAPLVQYPLGDRVIAVMPVKLTIAVLLIVFSLMELIPRLSKLQADREYLPLGGLLSGFFGGLSGHQGALRTAFLIRAGLSKETFIATGVVIACLIDLSRLAVYSRGIIGQREALDLRLIAAATLSAFAGAFLGSRLLHKITVRSLQYIVAVLLLLFAILLGAGIV